MRNITRYANLYPQTTFIYFLISHRWCLKAQQLKYQIEWSSETKLENNKLFTQWFCSFMFCCLCFLFNRIFKFKKHRKWCSSMPYQRGLCGNVAFFYVLLVRGVVLLCNTFAANKIKTSFSSQSVHSGFTVHRISFLYLASLSQSRCQHVHMKEALLAACHWSGTVLTSIFHLQSQLMVFSV